jgi:hypothetical protein
MPTVRNLAAVFGKQSSSMVQPPLRKKFFVPSLPALTMKTPNASSSNNNVSSPTSVSNSSPSSPISNTNNPTNPTNNTNKTQKVNTQSGKIGEECDPEYTNEDPGLPKGMSKLWRSKKDPTKVIYSPNPPYKVKKFKATFNGKRMVTVCKRKSRKSTRKTRKN